METRLEKNDEGGREEEEKNLLSTSCCGGLPRQAPGHVEPPHVTAPDRIAPRVRS